MKLFKNYTPVTLRKAIEIELQKGGNVLIAARIAIKNLDKDPEYYDLEKARPTKYIRKTADGKGGWKYFYKEVQREKKELKKNKNDIKLQMKFDSQELLYNYNVIGFEERVGEQKTSIKALLKAQDIENNIKFFDKEYTNIIDKNGNILFSKIGNYGEIIFNDNEIKKIRNAEILTHTHPEDKSFSAEDIFLALSLGIKEIRVKTPNDIYSFKISHKEKSRNSDEFGESYDLKNKNTLFMTVLVNLNNEITEILRTKVAEGKHNQKSAEKEHREILWNMIMQSPLLSKDFNIKYNKVTK